MKGDLCCTLRAGMLRVTIGPSVFEDMERNNIYGGGKSVRRRFRRRDIPKYQTEKMNGYTKKQTICTRGNRVNLIQGRE